MPCPAGGNQATPWFAEPACERRGHGMPCPYRRTSRLQAPSGPLIMY